MKILADSYISTSHQIMSAFVLSVIVRHNPVGQNTVVQGGSSSQHGSIIDISLSLLLDNQEDHPNLRKWLLICLGNVWENNANVKGLATRTAVYEKLYLLLEDPVPEVRAAAVFALGTFINSITARNEHINAVDCNVASTLVQKLFYDSSPLVRKEILVTMHWFIIIFENIFIVNMRRNYEESMKQQQLYLQTIGEGGPAVAGEQNSPQNSFTGSAPPTTANHMNGRLRSYLYLSLMPFMFLATNAIESALATANAVNHHQTNNHNDSPTSSKMRKNSSRSSINKLLSVPMSIVTTPSNG